MDNFILAIIFLAVIIIFTGFNSFYICKICDDMIQSIDSGNLEAAYSIWKDKMYYLSIFIRDAEIDVVNAEAEQLNSQTVFEDGEAEASKIWFREAVLELRNSEKPSFQNIFLIDIKL